MKAVFDTNVLAAAFTSSGLCHQLYKRALLGGYLVTTKGIVEELRRVLQSKFKQPPALTAGICAAVAADAEIVVPAPLHPPVCRDPDDDWVLAAAVTAQAECIVTGDDDLLVLKEYQGIRILTPRGFLELIDRRS